MQPASTPMDSNLTLTMIDGARIVVPNSLQLITPYVLLEQQDWFEDEIKFVRQVLKPGQQVIDIGANYGVYTLSMAMRVGPSGQCWCFEPATTTANCLQAGIQANGFRHVVLERSALSSHVGQAQLTLNVNSELNELVFGGTSTVTTETVPMVTLDECLARYGWKEIHFMKVDAEGQESNILKGGKRFMAELSPLVQYEIKAGTALHLELAQEFAALGYEPYGLVPGLGLLVPFDAQSEPDNFLLNLFSCKSDRAELLVLDQRLVRASDLEAAAAALHDFMPRPADLADGAYGWRQTQARLPYGQRLLPAWEPHMAKQGRQEVAEAIWLYNLSRDPLQPMAQRFVALDRAVQLLDELCKEAPTHLRLASLARCARELGARTLAIKSLQRLNELVIRTGAIDLSEPFLAPEARYESLMPGAAVDRWCFAGVLESMERLDSYSSFYTGTASQARLAAIADLGFSSAEMDRRLRLLRQRYRLATPQPV